MARSFRIEYPGAVYHVLNRGNYGKPVFGTSQAKDAFEKCLFQACVRFGWRLYAYCILDNHYHCALETTEANLSIGMQWLGATFANRFNRVHQVHGHLFQGRFKSLVVQRDEYLGPLIHYIHLNPVRAGLVSMNKPQTYRWSTLWYLHQNRMRQDFMNLSLGLHYAGDLADTPQGRGRYLTYLAWLRENDPMKRKLQFSKMSRGWALGCKPFKEELLEKYLPVGSVPHLQGSDFQEANQIRWEKILTDGMKRMGKTKSDLSSDRKSASWKVMIACLMKDRTAVSNRWLAQHLYMGAPQGVSRSIGLFRKNKGPNQQEYKKMLTITT